MYVLLLVAAALLVGAYFLFRDTMNRLQYIKTLRLYWITRDNAVSGVPFIARAFMKGTAPQADGSWYEGHGVQFRVGKYSFQVGKLSLAFVEEDETVGLQRVLEAEELPLTPHDIGALDAPLTTTEDDLRDFREVRRVDGEAASDEWEHRVRS